MGRLARTHYRKGHKTSRFIPFARGWWLPLVVSLLVFTGLHAVVRANPNPSYTELAQYLQGHELHVYSQPVKGYLQVFYDYNGRHIQLTDQSYNHASPSSSGRYIVWEGFVGTGRQIFLYDVLAGAQLQLSNSSINKSASVAGQVVTWQIWDGQNWQIMYYNGLVVQQLTSSETGSAAATTDGQRIAYVQQLSANLMRAQLFTLATGQTTLLREGDLITTGYPRFHANGSVTTAYSQAIQP